MWTGIPKLIVATVAISALLAGAAPAGAQQLDMTPMKLHLAGSAGIAYVTLIAAQSQGFLKKENLEVDYTTLPGSAAIAEALGANNVDVGVTSLATSVLATMKGVRQTMVAGLEQTFTDATGRSWDATMIVVRPNEGIKKISDFKGKRIAINDIGSVYNFMLRAQLLKEGLDPDKDLTILPLPFPQMAGALLQKEVDVIVVSIDGYYQAKLRAPVEVIGTHSTLEGVQVSLTSNVGVSNKLLQSKPDVVVRFLRALLQARLWLNEAVKTKPEEVKAMIAKEMNYSPDRVTQFYETRAGWYGRELEYVNLMDTPVQLIERNIEILKAAKLAKPDASSDYAVYVDIKPLMRAYSTLGLNWDPAKH